MTDVTVSKAHNRLGYVGLLTSLIDVSKTEIKQITATAERMIASRMPGALFGERSLSTKGDLFYFTLEFRYGTRVEFELPAELAVSDDADAIGKFLDTDAETLAVIKAVTVE